MEIDNTYRKEREDMGLDSILNFFKIPDDFDDEYEEEYVEEPVKAKPVKTQRQPVSQENDYEEPAPKQRSGFLGSKPKVVPMNRTMMEVSIIKPTTFEDSQNICIRSFRKSVKSTENQRHRLCCAGIFSAEWL